MKIWLDDIRPMPEGYDRWAKTAGEAIVMICLFGDEIEFISFDHDLGDGGTGYVVATGIEGLAHEGLLKRFGWDVHSQNPVGAERICSAMGSAERFWTQHEG